MPLDTAAWTVHLLFAGIWTGSVLFAAYAILPLAVDGDVAPDPLGRMVDRLRTISRVSALLLLLTGGHLAGTRYTVETLAGTGRGHLVLAMLLLWFVFAALVEVAAGKLSRGLERRKLREPARDARPFLYAAAGTAILLLANAGLLAAGVSY